MLLSRVKFCFLVLFFLFSITATAQTISLAGQWRFAIDREDVGTKEKWFTKTLSDVVSLPGSMTQNNKGDEVSLDTKWTGSIYDSSFFFRPSLVKYRQPGNIKIPFWLTPVKHYIGVAWYQKEIIIPATWHNKRVTLFLERTHIQTTVWIDDKEIGQQNSLVAPHQYTLGTALNEGRHTITIRVNNDITQMNVGPDSHSVSDHTQGNWNGIVGKLFLKATASVYIHNLQVYPDIKEKSATIKLTIINDGAITKKGKLWLSIKSLATHNLINFPINKTEYSIKAKDTLMVEKEIRLDDKMQLWDEFNPALYSATAAIETDGLKDSATTKFGMREIKAAAMKIQINGRSIHLRGDLNNCEFPLTGYPPTDVKSWERIYTIAKEHGLNHFRFHSWCPPEAAFEAADKIGFYLQPEAPTWPNHGTSIGDGRFIDQYIYDETNRMAMAYGNHPSFCMLAGGNEPAGKNQADYLNKFVNYWQAKDNRRLYTGASVAMSWPLYPESDYMIKSGPRGLNWNTIQPETKTDYSSAIEKFTIPYITHEMGQWCVFPNFKEIKKYTGVTRAKNFELFEEDLNDHGMADKAESFLMASGKLQALCYKQEIEKSLRTKNSAGFQLLGLQDFPGQGTALIGVLDAFWDEKGYNTAKEWRRFCNSTVPLSRIEKFTYTSNETFKAAIEVYHYGKQDLKKAIVTWTVKKEDGDIFKTGSFTPTTIATGTNTVVGDVTLPLQSMTKATRLHLEVQIKNTGFANDWDFWVYPTMMTTAANNKTISLLDKESWGDVYYTDTLDAKAEEQLNKGGTVFLNAAGKVIKGKEVVQYFTPVFWNTSWFKMRPPHTLGFVVDPKHPAFADFPTEYHSNLQWWEIVNKAQVMNLEDFPKGFQPVLQPIDTWFMNRKLAMLMEASVGKGKLFISTANLSDSASHPAARQLFISLKNYILSAKFKPTQTVAMAIIKDLFQTPSKEVWNSYSNANPDELKPKK